MVMSTCCKALFADNCQLALFVHGFKYIGHDIGGYFCWLQGKTFGNNTHRIGPSFFAATLVLHFQRFFCLVDERRKAACCLPGDEWFLILRCQQQGQCRIGIHCRPLIGSTFPEKPVQFAAMGESLCVTS